MSMWLPSSPSCEQQPQPAMEKNPSCMPAWRRQLAISTTKQANAHGCGAVCQSKA